MKNNLVLGKEGENIILEKVQKKGWEIVEKNFYSQFGEIDIIARDNDEIVFIEVKTRSNKSFGEPQEAVTKKKFKKMYLTAQKYLMKNNQENDFYRFDVFSVIKKNAKVEIEHFKNISFE